MSPGCRRQVKDTVGFRHQLRYLLDVVVACTKYNVSFFLILVATNHRFTHFFVTSSSFFGGERKHSHFPKLQSEKVKILTSPSIFADVGTKITVMENILHAFFLDKTEPDETSQGDAGNPGKTWFPPLKVFFHPR